MAPEKNDLNPHIIYKEYKISNEYFETAKNQHDPKMDEQI